MINVKSAFKLYEVINKHFANENDSRIFVSEIEEIMDGKIDNKMSEFATKKDFAELSIRMEQGFKGVEQSLRGIEQSLRDQLKWVIILMMSALSLMMAFSKLT